MRNVAVLALTAALAASLAAPAPLQSQTAAPASARAAAGGGVGFATAVALQGDELFIGRTGAAVGFPMPPSDKGSVHWFRRNPAGGWTEAASVSASDTEVGDGFGSALAVDGAWLAVGAPEHGHGKVYLFEKRDGRWTPAGAVALPDGAAGDQFGAAVALRGGVLLVGAPGRDSARGAAYAVRRAATGAWGAPARIGGGSAPSDRYGAAVALEGDRALVGAPGDIPMGGGFGGGQPQIKEGRAVLYRTAGAAWTELATLTPGADTVRGFGAAVRLAGADALVGAPIEPRGPGLVYAFRESGGAWSLATRIRPAVASPGAAFGVSLAGGGATLMVGAPGAGQGKGQVHVFAREGDGWTVKQTLDGTGQGMALMFGLAVALEGDNAVIGAPLADFFEGVAHPYTRDASGQWRAAGTLAEAPAPLPAVRGGEVRCAEGKAALFSCEQVDLLAFIPTSALGARRGIMLNDIWGWTDPETGREYALVGRMDATVFVDVTDPSNPVVRGELPLHQGANPNLWRDIKVYKNHAFIVSDGAGPHGMQVFDLTQLRNASGAPVVYQETAHYDRIASAHNIVINEETGFAYPVGASGGGETCGGALHMIDIRDPQHPRFAGCYADPSTGRARTGYTHDAQCVTYHGPDARYRGKEICFNASETAVGIADVTDKAAPKAVAVAAYPNVGYTHQGWLSEDHRYFYLDDELDEIAGSVDKTRTLVWDVADLEEPVLLTEFMGTTSASDHNLYVKGHYLFQSNYVAGLRVVDIRDPKNPREVGYFDTVPLGQNVPGFAGSWSNYPYFKSGTIVVTSMREGLFVLRHRPSELIP